MEPIIHGMFFVYRHLVVALRTFILNVEIKKVENFRN